MNKTQILHELVHFVQSQPAEKAFIVNEDVKVEGEIEKMIIPEGKYVVGHFEIGMDGFEKVWNTMCNWFIESGYQQGDGSFYELYHNDYTTHPEKKHIVDICIPVKPL